MITVTLTDEQAAAAAVALSLIRTDLVLSSAGIVGTSLRDLRGAQEEIVGALVRREDFEAMGVQEPNSYVCETWQARGGQPA